MSPDASSPVEDLELAKGTVGHLPRALPTSSQWWKYFKKWCFWLAAQSLRVVISMIIGLPLLYDSRLWRLHRDAELARQELLQFAVKEGVTDGLEFILNLEGYDTDSIPEGLVVYRRFAKRWERLADNFVGEWNAVNIVSAILVGAVLTIFQIKGGVDGVLERYVVSFALICAMYSLVAGFLLTVLFSNVRKPILGIAWAVRDRGPANAIGYALHVPAFWLIWTVIWVGTWMVFFIWAPVNDATPGFDRISSITLSIGMCMPLPSILTIISRFRGLGEDVDIAAGRRIQDALDKKHHPPSPPQTPPPPSVCEVEGIVQEPRDEAHHPQRSSQTPSLQSIFEAEVQLLHVNRI